MAMTRSVIEGTRMSAMVGMVGKVLAWIRMAAAVVGMMSLTRMAVVAGTAAAPGACVGGMAPEVRPVAASLSAG